jgi:hypothetical protein
MRGIFTIAAAALAVHACGGEPAYADSSGSASGPLATGGIVMDCADQATVDKDGYRAENNTWGKGKLRGWSQCIGLGTDARGALVGRWRWDWSNPESTVAAYPEIIFGQKPGKSSTSPKLPRKLSDLRAAIVTYDVSSTHTGSGNTAFDIWLTNTVDPTAFASPPITHELMIWLETYGDMRPDGALVGQKTIDGALYDVYVAASVGHGWRYIAFLRTKPQLGRGTIDLAAFLAHVRSIGLATGDEYLAAIEFGNEVIRGRGETRLNAYAVTLE